MDAPDRRSVILKAAARLFEHYGHAKTTIADVAREARVGVGTVYLEFDSKEALVSELSLSTHVSVLNAMRSAVRTTEDHADRLTAMLSARTSAFLQLRRKGHHACELLHCSVDAVRSAHEQFREQERTLLEVLLQEGQRVGTFTLHEPATTAALIQQAFASLAPPWIFHSERDAMQSCVELCELLLHGLVTEKRRGRSAPDSGRTSTRPARKATRSR